MARDDDTIKLSDFGVVIASRREWPLGASIPYGTRKAVLLDGVDLHTTQVRVYRDLVARKVAAIERGEVPAPRVETFWAGGKLWVLDGHHTLAAYRSLGRMPRLAIHDVPKTGMVAVPVAPKLFHQPRTHVGTGSFAAQVLKLTRKGG